MPLRGVLKCHCGEFLTGAASRGAGGSYYFYYKRKKSGHNNNSATKAHEQFEFAMQQLSIQKKEKTMMFSPWVHPTRTESFVQHIDNQFIT